MSQLNGQVCVITGANQGLGKAIAQVYAAEGAKLAICARNAKKLDAVAEELRTGGAEVLALPTDVSDEKAVADFFAAIMEKFRTD